MLRDACRECGLSVFRLSARCWKCGHPIMADDARRRLRRSLLAGFSAAFAAGALTIVAGPYEWNDRGMMMGAIGLLGIAAVLLFFEE